MFRYSTVRENYSPLGLKFAQIEVVTFLAVVFGRWKVEVAEGWDQRRIWDVLDRSGSMLTLAPQEEIPLRFRRL